MSEKHHSPHTIVCGLCGSRLLVQNSKNRHHQVYRYFVCARRHRKHDCTFRAVLINEVEEQVTDLYRQIHLTAQDRQLIERYLLDELEHIEATSQNTIRSLTTRRTHLKDQRHQWSGVLDVFRTVCVLYVMLRFRSSVVRVQLRSGCDNRALSEAVCDCMSVLSRT